MGSQTVVHMWDYLKKKLASFEIVASSVIDLWDHVKNELWKMRHVFTLLIAYLREFRPLLPQRDGSQDFE